MKTMKEWLEANKEVIQETKELPCNFCAPHDKNGDNITKHIFINKDRRGGEEPEIAAYKCTKCQFFEYLAIETTCPECKERVVLKCLDSNRKAPKYKCTECGKEIHPEHCL